MHRENDLAALCIIFFILPKEIINIPGVFIKFEYKSVYRVIPGILFLSKIECFMHETKIC